MEVHDFLLGDDMDLSIRDGDFDFGESTLEHQRDILLATKGSFRQVPLVGVGITTELLNDMDGDEFRRLVQQQMEQDGMKVARLVTTAPGEFELNTRY